MSTYKTALQAEIFGMSKRDFENRFWYLFLKHPSNGPSTGQQCAAALAQSRLDLLPGHYDTLNEAVDRLSMDYEILWAIKRYWEEYRNI
ncbi:MAG: hypothetical protein ACK4FF_14340 [Limnobacter sp.]|uniref:hypothetical protein n=1 Tax=Limnobacter sp. TaxID=2003368 RepID=UPI00391C59E3